MYPRACCFCYLHRDESCSARTELTILTYVHVLCLIVRMSRKHMACSGVELIGVDLANKNAAFAMPVGLAKRFKAQ
jgi:hypothetical protein